MRKPLTTIILSGFVKVSILGSEGFVANNLIAGLEKTCAREKSFPHPDFFLHTTP